MFVAPLTGLNLKASNLHRFEFNALNGTENFDALTRYPRAFALDLQFPGMFPDNLSAALSASIVTIVRKLSSLR